MIDWRKLKFPNENASANELHTILSEFLREGLDATDVEEQKRLQVILKRLELNRRNWSAMATVTVRDRKGCRRIESTLLEYSITAKPSERA